MLSRCCRKNTFVLMIGVLVFGVQISHASMDRVGGYVSLAQSSAYAAQGHQQTWWWYWWKQEPYPDKKPVKSVPVPTSLVPVGVGMAGILVWRTLHRRGRR